MRGIERTATVTAPFAVGQVATPASPVAARASSLIPSLVVPTSVVVAILSVLLLLTRPVAPSTSGAAGQVKTLDTHAALGA
jgi:hypothetical protein